MLVSTVVPENPVPLPQQTHPLAPFVIGLFEKTAILDVTEVAYGLAGALVRPTKGRQAYRIVAADILGYLCHQGVLVQHTNGHGNPRRPEDGGFWYTRKEEDCGT